MISFFLSRLFLQKRSKLTKVIINVQHTVLTCVMTTFRLMGNSTQLSPGLRVRWLSGLQTGFAKVLKPQKSGKFFCRGLQNLPSDTTFSKEEIHRSIVCLQIYLLICFSLRFPLLLNYFSKQVSLVSYSLFCSNHVSQCKWSDTSRYR